ncbi:MAG: hypothetical protein ACPGN3_05350 [Opitutales bacterium]
MKKGSDQIQNRMFYIITSRAALIYPSILKEILEAGAFFAMRRVMNRDVSNLLAAMFGVLLLFGAAFLFLREKDAPPVVDVPEPEPSEYFVYFPKFEQWLETPVKVHALHSLNNVTLEEIKNGQNIVRTVLFDTENAQKDLARIVQAVDLTCRDIVPPADGGERTSKLRSGVLVFDSDDLSDLRIPRRPQPSPEVAIPVAQDLDRLMRGFYIQDFEKVQSSFNIKADSWEKKYSSFNSASGGTRVGASSIHYIRQVRSFLQGMGQINDRYLYIQSSLNGTNEAREDWSKFKEESIPGLEAVIVGGSNESVEVQPGGRVPFEQTHSTRSYFVGELDIRGNKVFLLLGSYADPRMKVLWSHKRPV